MAAGAITGSIDLVVLPAPGKVTAGGGAVQVDAATDAIAHLANQCSTAGRTRIGASHATQEGGKGFG